jgi:hypothetical protein
MVSLKVYNLLGQEVATLLSEQLGAGTYTVNWNAGGMASGVYYYRLQSRDYVEAKKLTLLK